MSAFALGLAGGVLALVLVLLAVYACLVVAARAQEQAEAEVLARRYYGPDYRDRLSHTPRHEEIGR